MLVANKTDLRDDCEAEGRRTVKTEDGERLAKVCIITFNKHCSYYNRNRCTARGDCSFLDDTKLA